jgi:hypothetical protein
MMAHEPMDEDHVPEMDSMVGVLSRDTRKDAEAAPAMMTMPAPGWYWCEHPDPGWHPMVGQLHHGENDFAGLVHPEMLQALAILVASGFLVRMD